MVKEYEQLKVNQNFKTTLTSKQCKKIAIMKTVQLNPTSELTNEQMTFILKNTEQIALSKYLDRLTSGDVTTIESVIQIDYDCRQYNTQLKGVDRTRVMSTINKVNDALKFSDLLARESFTTQDLTEE